MRRATQILSLTFSEAIEQYILNRAKTSEMEEENFPSCLKVQLFDPLVLLEETGAAHFIDRQGSQRCDHALCLKCRHQSLRGSHTIYLGCGLAGAEQATDDDAPHRGVRPVCRLAPDQQFLKLHEACGK